MYTSIQINSFPGIKDGTYQLGNDTLIEGDYATGKTSLLNAISYALTGRDIHGLFVKNISDTTMIRLNLDDGSTFTKTKTTNPYLQNMRGFFSEEKSTPPISKIDFHSFKKDILDFIKLQNESIIKQYQNKYPQTSKEKATIEISTYKGGINYINGLPVIYTYITGNKMESLTSGIVLLNQLMSYSYKEFTSSFTSLESFLKFTEGFYTTNPFKFKDKQYNINNLSIKFISKNAHTIMDMLSNYKDSFETQTNDGKFENMWIKLNAIYPDGKDIKLYAIVDGKINSDFLYTILKMSSSLKLSYYKTCLLSGIKDTPFANNPYSGAIADFYSALLNGSSNTNLYKHFESHIKSLQKTANEITKTKTNYYCYKNIYNDIINEGLTPLNMNFNGSYITTKVYFKNELRDIETLSSYERFLYEVKITTSLMKMMNIPIILIDDFHYDLDEEFAENIVAQCEDLQLIITKRSLDKNLKIST